MLKYVYHSKAMAASMLTHEVELTKLYMLKQALKTDSI